MSLLRAAARARPRPTGRAYSSFFSSKPGGGRHLLPAKPPKPVLQSARTNVDPDAPAEPTPASTPNVAKPPDDDLPTKLTDPLSVSPPSPVHPAVSSNEYILHQFFSLHRPLLLLNQPSSAIFEPADPCVPLFGDRGHSHSPLPFPTIDNPPELSPDADADAARQLAHTLVMNRVAAALTWQHTLSRLGLSSTYSNDLSLAKETAQEWVTIHADSTRRKKRKKMKKHKLKKRRRLTRRQSK